MKQQGQGQRRNNSNNRNRARRGNNNSFRVQSYDSNGPDVRIRGTALQIYDKYCSLAKDAASVGDRIMAENYLQHAEHYQRIINFHAQNNPNPNTNTHQRSHRDGNSSGMDGDDEKLVDTVDELDNSAEDNRENLQDDEAEEENIDAAFLKRPVKIAKAAAQAE